MKTNEFHINKGYWFLIFVITFSLQGLAQDPQLEVMSAGGNQEHKGLFQVSWTIGEAFTESKGSSRYFVTQGFHQSEWTVVEVWEYEPEEIEMKLFPNPMAQYLNLSIPDFGNNNEHLEFVVHDFLYKPVFRAEIESSESTFYLDYLPNGTYIMNVLNTNGDLLKAFKVVKNQ
ncbi:MAG: T9SS type A sorting domain-containing protein [Flavobacteriales bacterium]|nr:T9SS type A sorting domain-containing protein [Flavobacteriales bacterium]